MEGSLVDKILGASPLTAALIVAGLLALGAVLSVRVVTLVVARRRDGDEISEPLRKLIESRAEHKANNAVGPLMQGLAQARKDIGDVQRGAASASEDLSGLIERVAVVEANQGNLTAWLTRVETKLDRVLER